MCITVLYIQYIAIIWWYIVHCNRCKCHNYIILCHLEVVLLCTLHYSHFVEILFSTVDLHNSHFVVYCGTYYIVVNMIMY